MKVLIADDERAITALISDALADEGIQCDIAYNGAQAVTLAESGYYDLIILDIMMPDMSGLEVCKRIRSKVSSSILFLTAKNRPLDVVVGLELGADDYIKKPFNVEELVAKVKAHIRRSSRDSQQAVVEIGDMIINKDSYEVYKGGKKIDLTTREFQLLSYFSENVNRVLTREQLYEHVWNSDYGDIGSVTVTIKNLRDKLDSENRHIKTVWGVGYKFVR